DTAATSMGNKTTTTLGRNSWDCENALELVRYKIEVTGTSPQTSVRGGRVGIFGGYVRAPGSTDSVERLSSGR
ncbi:MAG: hypothetical protein V2J02_09580, partial [Pseudomonadales bacterium]|nr:hypothetical protein [Pseudomonadales bacterium]